MTALTRILELLGTQERVYLVFDKRRPGVFEVAASDGSHATASGVGVTLEQACDCFERSAQRSGLMCEPVPRTEPNPTEGKGA